MKEIMKRRRLQNKFSEAHEEHIRQMNVPGLNYVRSGTLLTEETLDDGRVVRIYLFTTLDQLELDPETSFMKRARD